MAENEIKFFVKRIFTKDLSLESPETPQIFDLRIIDLNDRLMMRYSF